MPRAWAPASDYFERRVDIRAGGGIWRVEAEGLEPASFFSGAFAERHARRLASALARSGFDVTLEVRGRSGELLAQARRSALDAAPTDPPVGTGREGAR